MKIRRAFKEGRPEEVWNDLVRAVAGARRLGRFRIGTTVAPRIRAVELESIYGEMRLLYRTDSRTDALRLEHDLIELSWDDCDNWEHGGPSLGSPPYYLFVACSQAATCRAAATRSPAPTSSTGCRRGV
ncbi:MAG: hypothetical protein F4Y96_07965 [Chloroflexi bacterium]|nr:hypothetical protein [Chloroflexota bacterium]